MVNQVLTKHPSTPRRKSCIHSLGRERFCLIGPPKGLGHGVVEIFDEGVELALQLADRGEVSSPDYLSREDRKPDFNLVQP
jgi:hypothetical protein